MMLEADNEVKAILEVVWLSEEERISIQEYVLSQRSPASSLIDHRAPLPVVLPWSQTFYLCCQDVRTALDAVFLL